MNPRTVPAMPRRLFPPLSPDALSAMAKLMEAIREVRPLPAKRRKSLPLDIRQLWASLTAERDNRKGAYLSAPDALSAYLNYFLPWNVYRYLRLFPSLDLDFLVPGSILLDLGSGPLSVPIALYLAKPALRSLPLAVYAVDRAPQGMEAGFEILSALALALDGKLPEWKVIRVHGDAGASIKEKADLVAAGYFLNEFGGREAAGLARIAAKASRIMRDRLKPEGRILVLEAGETRSASLVSALRADLIQSGFSPLAPCPHLEPCPMPGFFQAQRNSGSSGDAAEGRELVRASSGRPTVLASGKRPWCHFTFDAQDAPAGLLSISKEAGLPKESASLSFLYASRAAEAPAAPYDPRSARIVSEAFPLPGSLVGRYACSASGYLLARASSRSPACRDLHSGDLVEIDPQANPGRDGKTRALLADLEPLPPQDREPRSETPLPHKRAAKDQRAQGRPSGPQRPRKDGPSREKPGKHRHT